MGIRKNISCLFGVIEPGGWLPSESTKPSLVLKLCWLSSQGKVFLRVLGLMCCLLFLSEMDAVRQTASSPPDLLFTCYPVVSTCTHILPVLIQPVASGRSVTVWCQLEQR